MVLASLVLCKDYGTLTGDLLQYLVEHAEGHSTTVSMKVSKTLDRGSIPRAPAKKNKRLPRWFFFV